MILRGRSRGCVLLVLALSAAIRSQAKLEFTNAEQTDLDGPGRMELPVQPRAAGDGTEDVDAREEKATEGAPMEAAAAEQRAADPAAPVEVVSTIGKPCAPGCTKHGNCNIEDGRCECAVGVGGERTSVHACMQTRQMRWYTHTFEISSEEGRMQASHPHPSPIII